MNVMGLIRKFFVVCLVAAVLSGCAGVMGEAFKETITPTGKARIYVYRPFAYVGGAVSYPVSINGEKMVRLPHTAYFVQDVAPGEIFVSAKTPENEVSVKINAQANKIYFIKGGTQLGNYAGRATLTEVHPSVGEKEIAKCKYYPQNDYRNKS